MINKFFRLVLITMGLLILSVCLTSCSDDPSPYQVAINGPANGSSVTGNFSVTGSLFYISSTVYYYSLDTRKDYSATNIEIQIIYPTNIVISEDPEGEWNIVTNVYQCATNTIKALGSGNSFKAEIKGSLLNNIVSPGDIRMIFYARYMGQRLRFYDGDGLVIGFEGRYFGYDDNYVIYYN